MIQVRRALLSVSDKAGIVPLARVLSSHGCELISTGGTRKALEEAGLPVTEISKVTGNPEAFGGRMKTISFQIESAILFDRDRDAAEAEKLGIAPIDMVVCNLYPFAKYRDAGADLPTLIENIDIGGPTMIRAAAKNAKYVAVLTDPSQYPAVEQALKKNAGALDEELCASLARAAFNRTADYDAMIAVALGERAGEPSVRLHFDRGIQLRYGENPHQKALFFREAGAACSLHDMRVLGGKEISFNNLTDLTAAIESAFALGRQGCAIIKHANPCGLAEAESQRTALELAWAGDPVSSFGSVMAFNRPLERRTVEFLELDHADKGRRKFVEVIAAPAFEPDALEYLRGSKGLRIVEIDPHLSKKQTDYRILPGAMLCQDPDEELLEKVEVVTARPLPDHPRALLEFGIKAVRQVKSNAIAVVRQTKGGELQLLGMGAGQPNRVNSTRLALDRARANLEAEHPGPEKERERYVRGEMDKAILVSDAFFPFPDNVELCAAADIRAIYQPGGSIRDREVIARCDDLGIAMAMTGRRHFKH